VIGAVTVVVAGMLLSAGVRRASVPGGDG
jgi:hypothetical protein